MRGRELSAPRWAGRRTPGLRPTAFAILVGLLLAALAAQPVAAAAIGIESSSMGGPPATRPVTLPGVIDSLPTTEGWIGDWTVAGVTVHVAATTTIDQTDGAVAVGASVLVRGMLQADRSINAESVEVMKKPSTPPQSFSFCGVVKGLPASGLVGDWTVNDVTVHVTAATTIDQSKGAVALDVSVRVTGTVQADASVDAASIVVKAEQCGGLSQPASMTLSILHLMPTPDAPEGAEGVVLARRMTFPDGTTREDLKVAVENLLPSTAYEVMIDAIDAGPIMTDGQGEGMLFLSTADIPGAEPLPADLQDFSKFVEADVNTSGGTTVLSGKFADAKTVGRQGAGLDFLGVAILRDPTSQEVVGLATATIKGSGQDLTLAVRGLIPGQTYTLMVDMDTVGTLTASARGMVEADYSNAPTGQQLQLPDALLPVSGLMHLELQDSTGDTVAEGDFQSVANPAVSVIKRLVKRSLHR